MKNGKKTDKKLSPHLRPRTFAASELVLDLAYILQGVTDKDFENMMIICCVSEATMRPFMLDRDLTFDTLTTPVLPEEMRGSISRLLIADRTGLPRETVRRKINALIKRGVLMEDENGRIRSPARLAEAETSKAVSDIHAAVERYLARLRQFQKLVDQAED